MPVKMDNIPVYAEVEGMGKIKLRPHITVDMLLQAEKYAEDDKNRLVNSIISKLLISPIKTPKDISVLPDKVVESLMLAIVEKCGLKEDFDCTSPETPIKERFYIAITGPIENTAKALIEATDNAIRRKVRYPGEFMPLSTSFQNITPSLERLSETEPSDITNIVVSQISLLAVYHNIVLDQAKRSFWAAIITSIIGFLLFLAAIGFVLLTQIQNLAIISVVGGTIVEFIAAIHLYLYGKASIQLADFQKRLDNTQRFMLANSVCEAINGELKDSTRSKLVSSIADISSTLKKRERAQSDGRDKIT